MWQVIDTTTQAYLIAAKLTATGTIVLAPKIDVYRHPGVFELFPSEEEAETAKTKLMYQYGRDTFRVSRWDLLPFENPPDSTPVDPQMTLCLGCGQPVPLVWHGIVSPCRCNFTVT